MPAQKNNRFELLKQQVQSDVESDLFDRIVTNIASSENLISFLWEEDRRPEQEELPSKPTDDVLKNDRPFNLKELPAPLKGRLEAFLSVKDKQNLVNAVEMDKRQKEFTHYEQRERFFKKPFNDAKLAYSLLKAVVTGDLGANPGEETPKSLINLINRHPEAFFMKGDILFRNGGYQQFYNVSPYQLMKFFRDTDMERIILSRISLPPELVEVKKEQDHELAGGGADLVKINFDPTRNLAALTEKLRHYTATYTLGDKHHKRITQEVTHSLATNPECLVYYKDQNNIAHWYWFEFETNTLKLLKSQNMPTNITREEEQTWQQKREILDKAVEDMEMMSAERMGSSEYKYVLETMCYGDSVTNEDRPIQLTRNGIQYERNGIRYCDTHYDFNRYENIYRKSYRLHKSRAPQETNIWKNLGEIQKEVMWVLQRFCQTGHCFTLSDNYQAAPFLRGFKYKDQFQHIRTIYNPELGRFARGFGSIFAIYKSYDCAVEGSEWDNIFLFAPRESRSSKNLIVINRLIEDAKTNDNELNHNLNGL